VHPVFLIEGVKMNKISIDLSTIQGIIFDMDGVLWKDNTPLCDLPEVFGTIDGMGLKVGFATNNAARSIGQYVTRLGDFGVPVEPWQIVTSGTATVHYLREQYPEGGGVFVIGEDPLIEELNKAGFVHRGPDPVAVVGALDRNISYQKMTEAALLIQRGVPFIGTNPDPSFPIPEGEAPGTGALLAALETTTGVSPLIIGKPETDMYFVVTENLGTLPEQTLVVGDRLETDILGAQRAGMPSALVLSGVTSMEEAHKWQPQPEIITSDVTSLVELLSNAR